jgi:hypothetical protein
VSATCTRRRGRKVLTVERQVQPVNLNDLRAGRTRSQWPMIGETKDWRKWGADELRGPLFTLDPPVVAVVEHLRPRGTSDTVAPVIAYKGLMDGLVDAGVLPDDGPKYLGDVLFRPPVIAGYHGLRLTLIEVPDVGTLYDLAMRGLAGAVE